jgi:hypothetical protein
LLEQISIYTQEVRISMQVEARSQDIHANGHIHQFTPDEASKLFDEMAEFTLGLSGDEFLTRWDAGEYKGKEDDPGISTMVGFLLILPER